MVTGLVKISINCSPLPFLFSASLGAPRFSLLFTDTKRHGLCLLVYRLQEKPCRLTKRLYHCGAFCHYHTTRFVLYQQKFSFPQDLVCALLQLFNVVLAHCINKVTVFLIFFYSLFHLAKLPMFYVSVPLSFHPSAHFRSVSYGETRKALRFRQPLSCRMPPPF